MEPNTNAPGTCTCKHHKIVPVMIILFGVAFLLADLNILTWSALNVIWPILIIVVGFMKFTKGKCKCCRR